MTDNHPDTPASDDAAIAFEQLRREVSLNRAAVEGLTAARERIPDYSATLGEHSDTLRIIAKRIGNIENSPGVSMTPASLALEIVRASETARAADQRLLQEARDAFQRSVGQMAALVDHGRAANAQQRALIVCGIVAFVAGVVLMSFGPGTIARSLPASWHVPEWMAAKAIGSDTKTAAERLRNIQSSSINHATDGQGRKVSRAR